MLPPCPARRQRGLGARGAAHCPPRPGQLLVLWVSASPPGSSPCKALKSMYTPETLVALRRGGDPSRPVLTVSGLLESPKREPDVGFGGTARTPGPGTVRERTAQAGTEGRREPACGRHGEPGSLPSGQAWLRGAGRPGAQPEMRGPPGRGLVSGTPSEGPPARNARCTSTDGHHTAHSPSLAARLPPPRPRAGGPLLTRPQISGQDS